MVIIMLLVEIQASEHVTYNLQLVIKGVKGLCMALYGKPSAELRSITCHSVTCHLTQVNVPHLNPSQAGWYSIFLPWRDGRPS